MVHLVLRVGHMDIMRSHVAAEAPLEACGLVAGTDGQSAYVFGIRNEQASRTHFRMDAKQQYEAFSKMVGAGWGLLAIYHSHPTGPAGPSETDLAESAYPGVVQLIWSPQKGGWGCHAFFVDGGQIVSTEFHVVEE